MWEHHNYILKHKGLCVEHHNDVHYFVYKGRVRCWSSITQHPLLPCYLYAMPALQSRSWICTLHIQTPEHELANLPVLPTGSPIEYAIGQLERGEESGALHWQFFAYFTKKKSLGGVKSALVEWLGDHAASTHVEFCRGTLEQCVSYVTKLDTRVGFGFEHGARPVVARSGRELLALFRSGGVFDPSDSSWDDVLLRFTRSRLAELRGMVSPRDRDPSVPSVCEVHYGPPGSGKSKAVFQSFPDAYIKLSGKWWDHYSGQSVVILDDFDGSFLSFGDFKRYIDRNPCLIEIKGGVVSLLATTFIITTNVYPSHWWSKKVTGEDGRGAIWRRISRLVEYQLPDDGVLIPGIEQDPAQYRLMNGFLESQDPKGDKQLE